MSERERLEKAIAALEAQRAALGDEVVETALAPLREQLAALDQGHPTPQTAERRIVTVLFCDVVSSTALADRLDPEVWRAIMNEAFHILNEPVERFGGTVARLMGDAILAFFGAPTAHEDDPQRAVSAGLAIVEGVQPLRRRLRRERGLDFNVRVGINTGLAVVGDVGSQVREEYTAMGDAVNIAARMEQTAAPGTVQITGSTHKLVAPFFDVRPRGRISIKGKKEGVDAYEVQAAAAQAGPARGLGEHGIHSPLVGREQELTQGRQAIAHLRAGHGGILFIFGEAGIGKSRLLAELRATAATFPAPKGQEAALQWLEGGAQPFGQTISFWPFLEILRAFAGINEEDGDSAARRKLEEAITRLFPQTTADVLPYLAAALSLDPGAAYADRLRYLDGEAMGNQITLAFRALFREIASGRPLVLVLEDVHWLDASSARLLRRLLSLVGEAPLLICAVSRPDPESPALQLAERAADASEPRYTEIRLTPLSQDEGSRLVDNLLDIEDLPARTRELILQKADGNPFYIEEIIRNLIEARAVVPNPAGGWRATDQVTGVPIPDTIQGVVMARVDRLGAAAKEVLRAAAVIGRIFLFRILQAILAAEDELERHLQTLVAAQIIRERQGPEREYIFKHALVRDAAYENMLIEERRRLHGDVGHAIERLFTGRIEEFYGLLAYHYTAAGAWEKAQHYLFRVGDQAQGLAADAEALAHYRRAIAAYEHAFDEKMAPLARASVERKMGEAYFRLGRNQESLRYLSSAMSRLDRPVASNRLGLALGSVSQIVRQLLHRLWPGRFIGRLPQRKQAAAREALLAYDRLYVIFFITGKQDRTLYVTLNSLNLAEATGLPQEMTRGYATAALGAATIPFPAMAGYYLRLARQAAERHEDPVANGILYTYTGFINTFTAHWDRALAALQKAADVYERIGNDRDWEVALNATGLVLQMTGDWAEKRDAHRQALASSQKREDRQMNLWSHLLMAEAKLRWGETGQVQEVFTLLAKAQAMNPGEVDMIFINGLQAQAHVRQGEMAVAFHEVRVAVNQYRAQKPLFNFFYIESYAGLPAVALDLWEAAEEGRWQPAPDDEPQKLAAQAISLFRGFARIYSFAQPRALLYQGHYDWLAGKQTAAQNNWHKGLALAEELQMPYEQALAHYEIARHLPQDDPTRHQHLDQAADLFSSLDARWHLQRVRQA